MEPKWKLHPDVDFSGGEYKVQYCKEQYCIITCNVRSMYQGKLEVVKQKMATMNIDILGSSELKWTGMGKFNSDGHCIYYHGQESNRRNAVALIINKRVQNAVLGCNLKKHRMISCKAWRTALWKGHSGTASSGLTKFIIQLCSFIIFRE